MQATIDNRLMSADRRCHASGCPIALSLDVFGDRWTLLVLRDLLFRGKRRFSEFAAAPEAIATNVLADRLRRLEQDGVVARHHDPADGRRWLYRATEKGADLIPVLLEIVHWGTVHGGGARAPAEFARRLRADREGFIAELRARCLGE